MKKIWNYFLSNEKTNEIDVPAKAEILNVLMVNNNLVIFVLVDPKMPIVTRKFLVVDTDDKITDTIVSYVGSFRVVGSLALVEHVFEIK